MHDLQFHMVTSTVKPILKIISAVSLDISTFAMLLDTTHTYYLTSFLKLL